MDKDKLDHMFELQEEFQTSLGLDRQTQAYKNINFMAMSDELHEFIRCTPWKTWKKQQIMDHEHAKEELVDVFHFFMNLCMSVEMDAEELYIRYKAKREENFDRQKRGY
jgi:dimeric dUTPase (all-alpha-NTP-PPase superfamily)